jgi:hypothetical protein
MSVRYSNQQVKDQQVRFETFTQSVNLKKLGERYIYFQLNDAENGLFTPHNYIHRVLNRLANVSGAMYHPATVQGNAKFYSELLKVYALNAYLDSILKATDVNYQPLSSLEYE